LGRIVKRPEFSHRNWGCRLRDFIWRGHRCIALENEALRILVAADKGADILEFLHKPTDTECLWQSPAGLQSPHFRPSSPLETGHFREYFAGGWYEMLPNGPVPCEHRGASFGHHGEATLLAWEIGTVDDTPEQVAVRFAVRLNRIPLRVEKTLMLRQGRSTLSVSERITNDANQRVEFLWGQHPTFGGSLLEPGVRVFLPACDVIVPDAVPHDARLAAGQKASWPFVRGTAGERIDLSVVPGYEPESHDFVRLENLAVGWFALMNQRRHVGIALRYNAKLFPVLGYWQLFGGGSDYPWYKQHFLAALEPACDLPSLAEAAKRGTALALEGGETLETTIEATTFGDSGELGGIVS
jgi:galactose mutarotase-like enzyme